MGLHSSWTWSGFSGAEAVRDVAAASAPFWLLLGGIIGLLVRYMALLPRARLETKRRTSELYRSSLHERKLPAHSQVLLS